MTGQNDGGPSVPDVTIRRAWTAADIDAGRALIAEYAAWLERDHGIGLAFQGIHAELEGLLGAYTPPSGALFVAFGSGGQPCGCVALRMFRGGICEIKRLYVRPATRGTGLGDRLIKTILQEARALGYAQACLDTAGFMAGALALYRAHGFAETGAYYDNPLPDITYLSCRLDPTS
ncbi:MAG: GNAT family N-acetyltransferase [Pseudomonadota bacterium]